MPLVTSHLYNHNPKNRTEMLCWVQTFLNCTVKRKKCHTKNSPRLITTNAPIRLKSRSMFHLSSPKFWPQRVKMAHSIVFRKSLTGPKNHRNDINTREIVALRYHNFSKSLLERKLQRFTNIALNSKSAWNLYFPYLITYKTRIRCQNRLSKYTNSVNIFEDTLIYSQLCWVPLKSAH